ncbi:MAG: hypothetical protein JO013_07775 [Alphaproteobacteria bacterium]|nr:hypothetical protein [Alphaproteobacteria bacterium]
MELIDAAAAVVLHFWPLTLVPALLLLAARPLARLVAFAGGLIFFLAALFLFPASGPDNPLLMIPFFGLPLSVAAMLAEATLRVARVVRSRRSGASVGGGG